MPEVCTAFQAIVDRAGHRPMPRARLERFAFYARAREAFALLYAGETRLYRNLLLRKGVIRPA